MSDLDVGDAIRLEDIPTVEGVDFLDDPHETVIANCTVPRGLAALEEEEAEAAEGEELEGEAAEGEAAAEAGEEPAAGETGESPEG